jgi:inhibitor of cysteine peptidase
VRLAENPTTGYRWELSQSGNGQLELLEDAFEGAGSNGTGAPGAAGYRRFRFIARQSGQVQLEASLRRSWEPPAAASRHWQLSVDIQ